MSQSSHSTAVARQAMVDSQIHTMGVVTEKLLQAFLTVPREYFAPDNMKNICYCDEDIQISQGRFLMEPSVLARMIEAVKPQPHHVILSIGSGEGYAAAILSHMVTTVFAIDTDTDLMLKAQKAWDKTLCRNIVGITVSDMANGLVEHAPYDIIIINGAVSCIPETLQRQVTPRGKIIAPVKADGESIAHVRTVTRLDDNTFSEGIMFDCGVPYLQGFFPERKFTF